MKFSVGTFTFGIPSRFAIIFDYYSRRKSTVVITKRKPFYLNIRLARTAMKATQRKEETFFMIFASVGILVKHLLPIDF